ncbi:unnamed protein product, partial [Effrenium voratum]
ANQSQKTPAALRCSTTHYYISGQIAMAISSAACLMSNVVEVLQPVASELVMFLLAAVVYLVSTRTIYLPKKKTGFEKLESRKGARDGRKVGRKEMEETPEVFRGILQHAKSPGSRTALAAR